MLLLAMMTFFEPNQGQAPDPAKFVLPAATGRIAFELDRAVFSLAGHSVLRRKIEAQL